MTIEVDIYGRNMNISDQLNDYISKKTEKLDRYLSGIEEAQVDLAYVKTARSASDRQVAQITVRGKKFILRSEERSEDIMVAFDEALEKIQRQISRYKGKHFRGRGDGKSIGEVFGEEFEYEDDDSDVIIVRRKKFTIAPMDENEAVEQMRLLGHENFFIFFNYETNAMNVLYRRRDGSYGLIEPELG